jgi:manganese efflux pump family protein
MTFGKLERVLIMAGARWRHLAAKAVTGVVLAGAAAGCASQGAAVRGSVNSCFEFGVAAIRHQVTVTALPPACQGLSQLEVNVALGRALHAAAARVSGKSRQRQVIGRDSAYLAHVIRGVRSPAQPAATAPVTHLPSRAALGLAALIAWLVTVGLGLSMMARWFTRPARHRTQTSHGRGPVLNFTHFGLALTGLLAWISYLATGLAGLAWVACGLLLAVASLGMALVFLAPDRSPVPSLATAPAGAADRPGDEQRPGGHRPGLVIAAHISVASVTILLAILAAIGSG